MLLLKLDNSKQQALFKSKISLKIKRSVQEKRCPSCAAILSCSSTQNGASCWCKAYPPLMSIEAQQDCLCENCLSLVIQEKISQLINNSSQQDLIATAHQYRHDENLIVGIDYLIENNNWVFTQWYHLKRGSCCRSACKNCPY